MHLTNYLMKRTAAEKKKQKETREQRAHDAREKRMRKKHVEENQDAFSEILALALDDDRIGEDA